MLKSLGCKTECIINSTKSRVFSAERLKQRYQGLPEPDLSPQPSTLLFQNGTLYCIVATRGPWGPQLNSTQLGSEHTCSQYQKLRDFFSRERECKKKLALESKLNWCSNIDAPPTITVAIQSQKLGNIRTEMCLCVCTQMLIKELHKYAVLTHCNSLMQWSWFAPQHNRLKKYCTQRTFSGTVWHLEE